MKSGPRREKFTVPPEADGDRLDRWLVACMPDFSRSALQRLIRDGRVRIEGRAQTKSGAPLRSGETIEIDVPPPRPAAPSAQPLDLDVVYEDEELLVLNKPAGMVVHPAAGNREGTLVNALLHHCRGLSAVGGVERPGIVHRLDKLTSGLMVVAKDDATHRHLAGQLADRTMKRIYVAVVWGAPQPPAGTIEAPIGRHPRDRKRMAVVKVRGRRARTRYRTLRAAGGLALLEIALDTGRTHQIRVHLSHLGYPVVGDRQYGRGSRRTAHQAADLDPTLRAAAAAATRQLLHARHLRFTHPQSGQLLDFQAPLPDDIAHLVAAMESLSRPGRRR